MSADGRWPLCGPPREDAQIEADAKYRLRDARSLNAALDEESDDPELVAYFNGLRNAAKAAGRVRAHLDGDRTYPSVRDALEGTREFS